VSARPQPPAKKAYTLMEFCETYRVSRSELYKLWARGAGPRHKRIGLRKIIILVEDAEAWAKSDEADETTAA
jgi:hypothetical protein